MVASPRLVHAALALVLALALGRGVVAGAQPAETLDLADVSTEDAVLLRVHGADGSGSRGVPVAGGRDCDGDGLEDLAFASIQASPLGREGAGEVLLVLGDGTVGGEIDTAHAHARVLRIFGAAPAEVAGSEIWIDDVTGDGLGDLLIARQNHTPDETRSGAGALSILVGAPVLRDRAQTGLPIDLAAPPPEVDIVTLIGAQPLGRLGIWVRTGDVTGDGVADIVVGADQEGSGGAVHAGAAYVVRGGSHLASTQAVDLLDFGATALAGHLARLLPPPGSEEYHLGGTVQIADLDGVGGGEVLVAATLNRSGAGIPAEGQPSSTAHSSGGSAAGTLFVAWADNFVGDPWPAGFGFELQDPPGDKTIIAGGVGHVAFGEELIGGFDWDDDGSPDLFVGDIVGDGTDGGARPGSGVGLVFYDAGSLRGLLFDLDSMPPGVTTTRLLGGAAGDISSDTAAAGDFDGDGVDDLAVASPHASPLGRESAGSVHLLFGRVGPWPATIDLAPGALPPPASARVTWVQGARGGAPNDVGDTLSYSAAVADLDGDGRSDLVTNEMLGNGVAARDVDAGNLIALSGARLTGLPACGDGLDNDADDAIDFPDDPGCTGPDDDSERARILLCSPLDPVCGKAADLGGSLKLKIRKTAKLSALASAQMAFGIGSWAAATGEGDVLSGAYAVVGKKRRKLELTLDADSLALLLARVAEEASAEAGTPVLIELRGLPKVRGKLRKKGAELELKLTLGVSADVGGRTRKGKYRWKLRGPLVPGS